MDEQLEIGFQDVVFLPFHASLYTTLLLNYGRCLYFLCFLYFIAATCLETDLDTELCQWRLITQSSLCCEIFTPLSVVLCWPMVVSGENRILF